MQEFLDGFGLDMAVEITGNNSNQAVSSDFKKLNANEVKQETENFQEVSLGNSFSLLKGNGMFDKKPYSDQVLQKNTQINHSLDDHETCACRTSCCIL